MSTRRLENLLEDSGECYHFTIQGNVQVESGEFSKRFFGMLLKISRDVHEDYRKPKFGFISPNFACFYQIFLIICCTDPKFWQIKIII